MVNKVVNENLFEKLSECFDLWNQGRKHASKATWDKLPIDFRKQLQKYTIEISELPEPTWKFIDFEDTRGSWTLSRVGKLAGKVTLLLSDLRDLVAEISLHV